MVKKQSQHSGHGGVHGVHQAAVVVGDHQLDPAQAAVTQDPTEGGPKGSLSESRPRTPGPHGARRRTHR